LRHAPNLLDPAVLQLPIYFKTLLKFIFILFHSFYIILQHFYQFQYCHWLIMQLFVILRHCKVRRQHIWAIVIFRNIFEAICPKHDMSSISLNYFIFSRKRSSESGPNSQKSKSPSWQLIKGYFLFFCGSMSSKLMGTCTQTSTPDSESRILWSVERRIIHYATSPNQGTLPHFYHKASEKRLSHQSIFLISFHFFKHKFAKFILIATLSLAYHATVCHVTVLRQQI